MTAGWDHLTPAWLTRLDARRGTPVNSILLGAALVMAFILPSTLGVREQEASQLPAIASIAHLRVGLSGPVRAAADGTCGVASGSAHVGEGGGAGGIRIERGLAGDRRVSDSGCLQPDGVRGYELRGGAGGQLGDRIDAGPCGRAPPKTSDP